jgi:transcriptional regulator with XRE-family HTH domain
MAPFTTIPTTVNTKDAHFFKTLGARVAQARKEQNLTQQQLAEQLGIAQQTLAHYEVGRLRVPASMLPTLAELLNVPVEVLLGQSVRRAARRGPPSKLQQQVERLALLPKAQQRLVMQMLDSVLAQASH